MVSSAGARGSLFFIPIAESRRIPPCSPLFARRFIGSSRRLCKRRLHEGSPLFMLKSDSLMPHAVCWSADPALIWTMVVTNLLTFFSYLTIAWTLLFLVRRTGRLIVRDWAY